MKSAEELEDGEIIGQDEEKKGNQVFIEVLALVWMYHEQLSESVFSTFIETSGCRKEENYFFNTTNKYDILSKI